MKFSTWHNGLSADASPDPAADYVVTYDASATAAKKVLISTILTANGGIGEAGWVAAGETWTYASADDPTFTFTIAGVDKTTKYYPGMRVKLTQTSAKYFIITKVAFSTDTTVTIYGGTDYDLANAAITLPFYSVVKAPAGFPMDPTKWTVRTTDTSDRSQATPTSGTWYNLGTITIVIPIGAWEVNYQVIANAAASPAQSVQIYTTLSTANNSQSDADLTGLLLYRSVLDVFGTIHRAKTLVLAAKTTYYLNAKTGTTSIANIDFRGDLGTTVIEALCAYL